MELKERAAYLKGLMEGLEIGDSKEGEVLKAMYDLLEDLCDTVADMDDDLDQVYDELDAMDEDMDDLEEAVFGDDEDEDDEEEDDEDEEVEAEYELTCPNCGAVTVVDEDTLLRGVHRGERVILGPKHKQESGGWQLPSAAFCAYNVFSLLKRCLGLTESGKTQQGPFTGWIWPVP